MGHQYSGGLFYLVDMFFYSAELSTEIVFMTGYKLYVHTLHSILQYICFIVLPCQPLKI